MVRENYTIGELKEAITQSICLSDVCRMLNITVCSFNNDRIRKLCLTHDISMNHFDAKKTFRRNKFTWDVSDVFCVNSKVGRSQLRSLAKRHGLYDGKCAECELNDEWNGKPLTIELDHINGINDDNRKENLRWLCPNCHSQTPTHKNSSNRRSSKV